MEFACAQAGEANDRLGDLRRAATPLEIGGPSRVLRPKRVAGEALPASLARHANLNRTGADRHVPWVSSPEPTTA